MTESTEQAINSINLEDLQAKYEMAATRLANICKTSDALADEGIISRNTAEHYKFIASSELIEPHPFSGLPCWCGEVHRRTV